MTIAPLLLQLGQNLDPSAPAHVDMVGSGLQAGGPLLSHCLGDVFTSSASPVEFILVRRSRNVCLGFIENYCSSARRWSEACRLGSVLLAGFLRGPGRSNHVSFQTIPGLACFSGELVFIAAWWWCCVASWPEVLWDLQVVPTLSCVRTSYPPSPPLRPLQLQPPPPGTALPLPLSQWPGWLVWPGKL